MSWSVFAPVLAAILLLILQGFSYWLLRRHWRGGVSTILLALMGLVLVASLARGTLVVGTEFRIVVAEGTAGAIELTALIIGLCVASGLGWHAVRCSKALASRGLLIVVVGVACGAAASARMPVLSSDDGLRYFDRWFPVLAIWLALCFSESLITFLGVRNRWARFWSSTLLPVGLALYAVHRSHQQFHYGDPWTLPIWKAYLLLALPAVMVFGTLFAMERMHPTRRWPTIVASTALGAAGLISAASWIYGNPESPLAVPFRPWFLWLAWMALLALTVTAWLAPRVRKGEIRLPDFGRAGRWDDMLALVALAALAAGCADVLHFGWLEPVWDLAVVVFAWAALLELMGGGPLVALVEAVAQPDSPLVAGAKRVGALLGQAGDGILAWIKWLFKADSKAGAILKFVGALVVLVAVLEIPNARKTIVMPFGTPDTSQDEQKQGDRGRVVSDRIANTLGLVGQELQPDMTVYQPSRQNAPTMAAISEEMGGLQAEVKGIDVTVWGTKIPIGLLTAPVVEPMRWILGVRVIHGSVVKNGGAFVLLANSTRGEAWRIDRREASDGATAGSTANEPIDMLADRLAYQVMSSDPALARFGMTRSWPAIEPFRKGVRSWKKYELGQDFGDLADSIAAFQEAVKTDPEFALAHYRLGRAMAEDGQPAAAMRAFRAALQANPQFAAARMALANTDLGGYRHLPAPSAVSDGFRAQFEDARTQWRAVVGNSEAEGADRAAAYCGLCGDTISTLYSETDRSKEPERYLSAYLAFFYCKRAEDLYAHLAPSTRADFQVQKGEATALYRLGLTLEIAGDTDKPSVVEAERGKEEAEWHCLPETITEAGVAEDGAVKQRRLPSSLFARESLRYYRLARALLPRDPVIGCAVASQSLARGDHAPMAELRRDADAHYNLAESLSDTASSPKDYRLALLEYQRAVALAPRDVDALNDYAYTFWQWKQEWPQPPPRGPEADVASLAEEYAAAAVRLSMNNASSTRKAVVQSTLGEVLLGEGRLEAARKELESAYSKVAASKHAYFNELRWDLVRAYGCKSSPRVLSLLEEIRASESAREAQLYTEYLGLGGGVKIPEACGQQAGP